MKTIKILGALALGGLAVVGCGSDSGTGVDGGATDALAAAGDGPTLYFLSRGMNDYNVTGIKDVMDPCMKGPNDVVGSKLPVNTTYNDATMVLTIAIGKMVGTPAMPSLGSGTIKNNTGVLMRENDSGDGAGCTWHEKVVGNLTMTAGDQFTLAVTDDMSNFDKMCKPADVPMGGKCTSKWTWDFKK